MADEDFKKTFTFKTKPTKTEAEQQAEQKIGIPKTKAEVEASRLFNEGQRLNIENQKLKREAVETAYKNSAIGRFEQATKPSNITAGLQNSLQEAAKQVKSGINIEGLRGAVVPAEAPTQTTSKPTELLSNYEALAVGVGGQAIPVEHGNAVLKAVGGENTQSDATLAKVGGMAPTVSNDDLLLQKLGGVREKG